MPDLSAPHAWLTDSEVTLKRDAVEFAWLNRAKANWSGAFDMSWSLDRSPATTAPHDVVYT
ncbi:MAG: hypothetical protein QGI49_09810 [SAR202 cluster bacterium]|nr:hypothetical protein [SAR202 cluster bacterium]